MKTSASQLLPDTQLVIQYQKTANPKAFGELYKRYYPKLYKYCIVLTKDREVSLDLTQDVFLKTAEKLHTLQYPITFTAWLFRIAHNECIDYLKNAQKQRAIDIGECYEVAAEVADETVHEKERLFEKMEYGLKSADPETQDLLKAKYLERASIHDLTERYGISESAMKMRLSRARERVAKYSQHPASSQLQIAS